MSVTERSELQLNRYKRNMSFMKNSSYPVHWLAKVYGKEQQSGPVVNSRGEREAIHAPMHIIEFCKVHRMTVAARSRSQEPTPYF